MKSGAPATCHESPLLSGLRTCRHRAVTAAAILGMSLSACGASEDLTTKVVDGLEARLFVTAQSAYGPEVVLLVTNRSEGSKHFHASAGIVDPPECFQTASRDLPWRDPTLTGAVEVELARGASFAVIRPTLLIWPRSKCQIRGEIKATRATTSAAPLQLSGTLDVPHRSMRAASTAGGLAVTSSVARIKVVETTALGNPEATLVEVQLLVTNESQVWRDTAILDRQLTCSAGSTGKWATGPAEPPTGLHHGPAEVPPQSTRIFVENIWVYGTPADCTVRLDVRQWLADARSAVRKNDRWESVSVGVVRLEPSVEVTYH